MMLRPAGIALIVLVAGWTAQAQAEEPILLKYKAVKGDTLYYKTTQEMKQAQSVMGMNFDNTLKQETVVSRVVDSVDEAGNATFKVKADRRKMTAAFGALGKFEFDSKSTERDTASSIGASVTPLLERLTGSEYQIVMSPRGLITEVKGYAELTADLLKDNPFGASFGGAADNKTAVHTEQTAFVVLSDKPVKPGDKWEVPFDVELTKIGKLKGKITYTYEGPDKVGDRRTARIGATTEISMELDIDQGATKVKGTLATTSASGTVQFDPEAGRVVSIKQNSSMTGKLTVEAGGMMIPVENSQDQTESFELLDKLPE